jgi:ATP-dependent RNA helicase RhlE
MEDAEVFNKVVVFVNTRLTAEKVFKSLFKDFDKQISVYKPLFFDYPGFDLIDDFKESEETRILIVADDLKENIDLSEIPFILHLEIPAEKETFISRVVKNDGNSESLAISFSTDIELVTVKKIEQAIGQIIPVAALPEDLIIAKDSSKEKKNKTKASKEEELTGAAFHEKKESNNKDYNYSSREKAKMKFKNR